MRRLGLETAQKIAAAWDQATSLKHAMELAGVKSKDPRKHNDYRRMTEEMLGIRLHSLNPDLCTQNEHPSKKIDYDHPYSIVIFSDAHFWPGDDSPAYWGLLDLLEKYKPDIVIDNGDSLDGASVSRHPKIGWELAPSLTEEIGACKDFLGFIKDATPDSDFYRNIGNHDLRFEMKLANSVPEFKGVKGFTLKDCFPDWDHCTSLMFNESLLVKHRWKGGTHAAWNNAVNAGRSIATGHTHRLTIREVTNLNGTHYGIECGTLAPIYGDQFGYCEHNPVNWQGGFMVIEVDGGNVFPEKAELIGNKIRFRGEYYG